MTSPLATLLEDIDDVSEISDEAFGTFTERTDERVKAIVGVADPPTEDPPDGTTGIWDWHDLDAVRDDLDGDYVLMRDLDEDTDGYDDVINTENGFEPIGDVNEGFNGTFDGNGHTISGLTIDRPNDGEVGLFGAVEDEDAIIQNVLLKDVSVEGDVNVGPVVGALFDGTIRRCATSGIVKNGEVFDGIGGIVGKSDDGLVKQSYSACEVDGRQDVGGILGYGEGAATVRESFAYGEVDGESFVGGLIGFGGEAVDAYWDKEATGQTSSSGGQELPTTDMQGEDLDDNFDTDLDFADTWKKVTANDSDAQEDGYPILQVLDRTDQLDVQGIHDA